MKCNGNSDLCGKDCELCARFMDDCDGCPDWDYNENNEWREVDEN